MRLANVAIPAVLAALWPVVASADEPAAAPAAAAETTTAPSAAESRDAAKATKSATAWFQSDRMKKDYPEWSAKLAVAYDALQKARRDLTEANAAVRDEKDKAKRTELRAKATAARKGVFRAEIDWVDANRQWRTAQHKAYVERFEKEMKTYDERIKKLEARLAEVK